MKFSDEEEAAWVTSCALLYDNEMMVWLARLEHTIGDSL